VFVGKTYEPVAAAQHRLIDEVVDGAELMDRARAIAERLATEPVARFRITKQQLRRPVLDAIVRHDDETAGAVIRGWQGPRDAQGDWALSGDDDGGSVEKVWQVVKVVKVSSGLDLSPESPSQLS